MSIIPPAPSFEQGLSIIRIHEPTLEFTTTAQFIGHEAWSVRLPKRSDNEIRHVFNPDNPQNAKKLLERMNSKIGQFVGTIALKNGEPIGYAWAHDDIGNMSIAQQKFKMMAMKLDGKKPYIWVAHINVLSSYQSKGIGSVLLKETLDPFDDDKKISTYVFDENQLTLNWFKKFGFIPKPKDAVDPNDRKDGPDIYFGEGAEHVSQWRLEAPQNIITRNNIISQTALHCPVEDKY